VVKDLKALGHRFRKDPEVVARACGLQSTPEVKSKEAEANE